MPFKEILEWMQSKNMVHLAPAVAKLGVQNLSQLKEIERSTLQARQWNPGDIDIFMNLINEQHIMYHRKHGIYLCHAETSRNWNLDREVR